MLDISLECLKAEMVVANNCLVHKNMNDQSTTDDLINVIQQNIYPNLYKLIQVGLTIPISSATCERSFSAMRRIKTWLRTSMLQSRFNNVSILYIEKDMSKDINTNEIVQFSGKNQNIILY